MAERKLSFSVSEDHLDRTAEVAERLRERGLQVDQVLDQVGVITGSVDDAGHPDLAEFRTVEGVEGVEAGGEFQLPEPGNATQ